SVALAPLLPALGSNWSAWMTVATLVWGAGPSTRAAICNVCGAPAVTVPTSQAPVALLYVPWLGAAETKARPAGSRSATDTLVAASGPLLVRVMVKVTVSPRLGVGLLTTLARARSARWGVSVAL